MDQGDHKRLIQLEATVNRLEAMMEAVLVRLDINPAEFEQEPPAISVIREELLAGNKIKAIKLYRELYGVGLKEAKDAVDSMQVNLRR
ncbi:MAG TPA: ribosomal protein L7/L12 [Ktedonobacteraceae bacterium]|jgi:ribosomal protein L7/L12